VGRILNVADKDPSQQRYEKISAAICLSKKLKGGCGTESMNYIGETKLNFCCPFLTLAGYSYQRKFST
jgi:hypothetical protein